MAAQIGQEYLRKKNFLGLFNERLKILNNETKKGTNF